MFEVAHGAFAKHGDSFFLEESGGVLIVSEALLEKKREFLFSKRQEVLEVVKERLLDGIRQKELERHEALGTKRDLSGVMCMACEDESVDGVFPVPSLRRGTSLCLSGMLGLGSRTQLPISMSNTNINM
ncbi:MAG: uncharacterized protein A8A55_1481 [Amphiamblys sp. WSBS2006]|nr:MAG: uncharacterized protein A8A55_1481 [Amphiamblys sp. WSBS2006]